MGSPIQGTQIIAPIVPFNTDDIYATHDEIYGKGGFRSVTNLTERDAIKELRRKNLMLVGVAYNSTSGTSGYSKVYQLWLNNPDNALSDGNIMNNNNWVEFKPIDGQNWTFPAPGSSVYPGVEGERSFDDNFVYICIEDNLWKRIPMEYFIWGGGSTSGFDSTSFFVLEDGAIPVWDGTNGDWSYSIVVKNVTPINTYTTSGIDGTSSLLSGLLVTFTNNTSQLIEGFGSGGDNWILPPPATSGSIGNKGDRSYDDKYLYLCVAANTWKRINVDYFVSFTPGTSVGFDIADGLIPIWSEGDWDYRRVVENITKIGNNLDITYSNTSGTIDIGGLIYNKLNNSTINGTGGISINIFNENVDLDTGDIIKINMLGYYTVSSTSGAVFELLSGTNSLCSSSIELIPDSSNFEFDFKMTVRATSLIGQGKINNSYLRMLSEKNVGLTDNLICNLSGNLYGGLIITNLFIEKCN